MLRHTKIVAVAIFWSTVTCVKGAELEAALPEFSWDPIEKSDAGVPLLHIEYPDGRGHDVALLKPSEQLFVKDLDKEEQLRAKKATFNGVLRDEQDVYVVLNGLPLEDNFEVGLNTENLENYMYVVKDGISQVAGQASSQMRRDISNHVDDDMVHLPKDVEHKFNTSLGSKVMVQRGSSNKNHRPACLKYKVSLNLDEAFVKRFNTTEVINERVNGVLNIAKAIYKWNSLKTKVELDIVEIVRISGTYTATDKNIDDVAQSVSSKKKIDANAYAYLSYDNNSEYGILGIAFFKSTCAPKAYRSSISEWYSNDIETAGTLTHEMGHNLGAKHDFNSNQSPRFSSTGEKCTKIGGIMDYATPQTKWSPCSVEDMDLYYNEVVGKKGSFCMAQCTDTEDPDDSGESGKTTTTPKPGTPEDHTPEPSTPEPSTPEPSTPEPCEDKATRRKQWLCRKARRRPLICRNRRVQKLCENTCHLC